MKLFHLFAELLSYPRPGLAAAARECEALVAPDNPEAAALLHAFAGFAAETPPGRLEEVYTAAFDLDASSSLYVAYHLLGESYKRSVFMLELKRCYEAQGLDIGSELPDHLAVVLRFLAACTDAELAKELVSEALVPALEKRLGRRRGSEGEEGDEGEEIPEPPHPYVGVLRALVLVLQRQAEAVESATEGGGSHG